MPNFVRQNQTPP